MHYKTLVLQLIREHPLVHYPLKEKKMLLKTVEREAAELAGRHTAWKEQLAAAQPGYDPVLIESAALELALQELEDRLRLPPEGPEPLSLEAAMAYLKTAAPRN